MGRGCWWHRPAQHSGQVQANPADALTGLLGIQPVLMAARCSAGLRPCACPTLSPDLSELPALPPPRQPWFYGWGFNLPRGQALLEKWNLIPEGVDILITHGPPLGKSPRPSPACTP